MRPGARISLPSFRRSAGLITNGTIPVSFRYFTDVIKQTPVSVSHVSGEAPEPSGSDAALACCTAGQAFR